MRTANYLIHGLVLLWPAFTCLPTGAQDVSLEATLDELVSNGDLVAAQAVVGLGDRIVVDHATGVTNPEGDQSVDANTQFCIGSCSKPFASAVVMSLVDDAVVILDQPIAHTMPDFGQLRLINGELTKRSPTMLELLAHRSGIYSQKNRITPRQVGWTRNFTLTLDESVQGIANEPLASQPGSEYAYSGAGYCVAGRVAEVASGTTFERLLQNRIARPLDLKRTTYFPNANERNIATGGRGGVANPKTPHLSEPALRLPLIGGSLYSTARETGRFLRMVADRGMREDKTVISRGSWNTWTARPYPEGEYGLGWGLRGPPSNARPTVLSHSGSLASSRSNIVVVLRTGVYAAVHYTVSGENEVATKIKRAMGRAIQNAGP